MKKFFGNIGIKMQRFMYGRYGMDELWRALLIFYIISIIIASILYRFSLIAYYAFVVIGFVIIAYAIFRAFSKNIEARRAENQNWLKFTGSIKRKANVRKNILKQKKTHKFVKCKQCKKTLRLPKNRGKLNVTCPHCKYQFTVNTGKKKVNR